MVATFWIVSGGIIILLALAVFTIMLLQEDALKQQKAAPVFNREATPFQKVSAGVPEQALVKDPSPERVPEAV
ncbi:hypothetical protein CLV24_103130 [Pontibacter ummariensis]|uniref:Uncharacterized protein n=1 Tax=Pontibacter ummariensis TaxID=1610492 RepID=A0A239CPT8_9BACT|nr:hypothetical protein CLV24_103130 [Pontibacter ummariensis]SNS22155.1 hypothetical protein SAMN06296052_103183 [Pontibacter ummariensis]